MKLFAYIVMLAMLLFTSSTVAQPGYLTDSRGEIVRNNYGDCWHTSEYKPEMAVIGCDGKTAAAAQPEAQPVDKTKPPSLAVVLDSRALFAFDKATLRPQATEQLDALLAQILEQQAFSRIAITGHADRIGDSQYNLNLSLRRAETVRQYLQKRLNVADSMFEVTGMGEQQPIVSCDNLRGDSLIDCLQPNRRVEVIVNATQ